MARWAVVRDTADPGAPAGTVVNGPAAARTGGADGKVLISMLSGRCAAGDRKSDRGSGLRLASRTGLPGAQGQRELVQDLIGDLMAERAHGCQDLRDLGHPGGAGFQGGLQRRYPASGVAVDRAAADADRGRGLGLGQVPVILQRDYLALAAGQVVQRSRDSGPLPHDESPAAGTWHVGQRHSAVPRKGRGTPQLRLGHQPQVGLRAFAVHLPQCPPAPRRS